MEKLNLPPERPAVVVKFRVADWPGYLVISEHDGKPAELFIHCSKEGSTVCGFLDAIAIAISIGLRSGVPAERYVKALSDVRFEPNGYAKLGSESGIQVGSIIDAVMKILVKRYPDLSPREPST